MVAFLPVAEDNCNFFSVLSGAAATFCLQLLRHLHLTASGQLLPLSYWSFM
jgi:hypothetical protein